MYIYASSHINAPPFQTLFTCKSKIAPYPKPETEKKGNKEGKRKKLKRNQRPSKAIPRTKGKKEEKGERWGGGQMKKGAETWRKTTSGKGRHGEQPKDNNDRKRTHPLQIQKDKTNSKEGWKKGINPNHPFHGQPLNPPIPRSKQ
jgi:hypothetical protein